MRVLVGGLLWATPAAAFTLQAPVYVGSMSIHDMDAAGDTVGVVWADRATNDVRMKTSTDRGRTFGPSEVVVHVQPTQGQFRTLEPFDDPSLALSGDGTSRAVLGALELEDSRVPPIYQDRFGSTPALFWGIGTWRDDGPGWYPAHVVDVITDSCDAGWSRCLLLFDVDLALSDDGAVAWAAWVGWDRYLQEPPRGNDRQLYVSRMDRGLAAGAGMLLTAEVGVGPTASDDEPSISTDATGEHVVVEWTRGTSPMTQHLSSTLDGGVTWSDQVVSDATAGAAAVAKDTGTVVWATMDTCCNLFAVRVRRSTDGGLTFGAAVTVDSTVPGGGGRSLSIDDLEVATSRDGQVIAVAYGECPAGGCGFNAPTAVLAASDDGGATFARVGVLGQGYGGYHLAVAPDGGTIYASYTSAGTNLYTAIP